MRSNHFSMYTQSCPTLHNPMDYSPPDSSVHRILQVRTLEWVTIPFSKGLSQHRDWTHVSWVSCIGRHIIYHCCHLGSQNHFQSVQFSRSVVSDSLQLYGLQHVRTPCPSPTPGTYTNSCPLSPWCHPIISSSVVPFFSHLQSIPAPGSFQMSQLFASGGQSIGVSASTLVLPVNTQDWSPLGWTGWISLQSKGLSRVFSNTIVQKHQFFCAQLSLQSNSHNHTWLLEK